MKIEYSNLPSVESYTERIELNSRSIDEDEELETVHFNRNRIEDSTEFQALEIGNSDESDAENILPDQKDDEDSEIRNTDVNCTTLHLSLLLAKRAIPVCLGFLFMYLNSFITLTYAGHLNLDPDKRDAVFAGVSLATMTANVSFVSLMVGMSSGIDTLCSQHFGARNYKEVGIILQRAVLICSVMGVPLLSIWFFSAKIFVAIGVDPYVADIVQSFLMIKLYEAPFVVVGVCYEKYLSSFGVVNPPLYANITTNVTLAVSNYILIKVFDISYQGLAISNVLASVLSSFMMILASIRHPDVQKTLQPLSWDMFYQWWEFCSLGLPATLMLCSEWWAFEILIIMASLLGTSEVDAQTITMQTGMLAYMIPLGISISTSSLVGNFLGAEKPTVAVRIGKLAYCLVLCTQILIGLTIFFFGHWIAQAYTDDQAVIRICLLLVPFLSFFCIIDGLVAVGSGILKGVGKQRVGAITNILSFYGIGLPMAYYLCFHTQFEVRGLLMGLSFGTACQALILLWMVIFREKYIYTSDVLQSPADTVSPNASFVIAEEADLSTQESFVDEESNKENTETAKNDTDLKQMKMGLLANVAQTFTKKSDDDVRYTGLPT